MFYVLPVNARVKMRVAGCGITADDDQPVARLSGFSVTLRSSKLHAIKYITLALLRC